MSKSDQIKEARRYMQESRDRAMSAYANNLKRLDELVLAALVEEGKAYWAEWYGEDYDWSEDSESSPDRKAFEFADQAMLYLVVEVDYDQRIGVSNPDGSYTHY